MRGAPRRREPAARGTRPGAGMMLTGNGMRRLGGYEVSTVTRTCGSTSVFGTSAGQ